MKFSEVKNPQWANIQKSQIDCLVTFDHIGEPVPFTASEIDNTSHGVEIFNRAASGEFGEVATYVPPPEPVTTTEPTTA